MSNYNVTLSEEEYTFLKQLVIREDDLIEDELQSCGEEDLDFWKERQRCLDLLYKAVFAAKED